MDYYRFSGLAGQLIVADIDAWVNGCPLDSMLTLFDSDGTTVLDENDDFARGTYDSHLEHTLPHDSTFYLRVQDWSLDGWPSYPYALSPVCNGPRDIAVTPSSLGVRLSPGQIHTATLTISNSGQRTLHFGSSEEKTGLASAALASQTDTVRIFSDVTVTFNAAGLTAGTYPANLLIFDDDSNEILVTVPVTLTVTLTVSPVLPGDVCGDCDVDGDGDIDVIYIMLVAAHWGDTCSGAALRGTGSTHSTMASPTRMFTSGANIISRYDLRLPYAKG